MPVRRWVYRHRVFVFSLAVMLTAGIAITWVQYHINILQARVDSSAVLTQKDVNDAMTDMIRTGGAVLGAFGLFGTLIFSLLNYHLSRSGQVTDRFAKAVAILGS